MRCSSSIVALAAAAMLVLLAVLAACSPSKARGPSPLTLYFTCDTDGRLEPCGCFTGQFGGLSRVKRYVDLQAGLHPILVDVGNAIEGTEDFEVIKYRYVQKAFAAMGFAALNLGGREARLPAAQIRELAKASPVPMISANLLDAATGKPICQPVLVMERDGRRVGFVGVVDQDRESEVGEGLAIEPIETSLARLLPALKGQTDLLVLLAFADEEKLFSLAKQFYEFDLILGGKVRQPSQQMVKENRSVVLYTTNESKALGVLKATINGPSELAAQQSDIVLMSPEIPQEESIVQLSRGYRDEIKRAHLHVDNPGRLRENGVPGVHQRGSYAGSSACQTCHSVEYGVWAESRHKQAFVSLTEQKAEFDPACVACHTVGFGAESGFRRGQPGQPELAAVGCESCHGPASEHVRRRQAGETGGNLRPVGATDCTKCHRGEFSRPFQWEEFWPKIQHGLIAIPAAVSK